MSSAKTLRSPFFGGFLEALCVEWRFCVAELNAVLFIPENLVGSLINISTVPR